MLKKLDSRGHFLTILDSFRRGALYENIEKYQKLKDEMYGWFLSK